METNIQKVLLTKEQIAERIAEMGRVLSEEYAGKDPVFKAASIDLKEKTDFWN